MGDFDDIEDVAKQLSIRVNSRTKIGKSNWSIGPNIERAVAPHDKPARKTATPTIEQPKPPEIMLIDGRFELYRVVLDYEALQDAFADRIEDLNTTLTEIDSAAGLTNGHMQRLINTNPEAWRPKGKRRQSRQFAWKTLAAALRGTGMALVLVVDDERFAVTKERLAKRRRKGSPTNVGQTQPTWLFTREKAREMRSKWWSSLTPAQQKKHQRKAQRGQAASRRRKARAVGALLASKTTTKCAHGHQATAQIEG